MKTFRDCMSPLSWALTFVACAPTFILVFRPTLLEFLIFFGVDGVAFYINRLTEGKVFQKIYPDTRDYFESIDELKISKMNVQERVKLFESLCKFPLRRAVYFYFWAFVKVSPAIGIVTFYWHRSHAWWVQFALIVGIVMVNFCYYYGTVFIESHRFVSKLISDLHRKFNFADAFRLAEIRYSPSDFQTHELLSLGFMISFVLGLQSVIIISSWNQGPFSVVSQVITVGLMGVVLFLRIWHLGRNYFIGGLEALFKRFDQIEYKNSESIVPLSSSGLLAKFEKTFNSLIEKLSTSERELTLLILQETEKSRFRALGEMAALVVHDLSSPLTVVRFCVTELEESPARINDARYMKFLSANVDRAIALIQAIRSRFKAVPTRQDSVPFREGHENVWNLLSTQFYDSGFSKISVEWDNTLDQLVLKMNQIDLTHILDNLYRNAIVNLLKNDVASPMIKLSAKPVSNQAVKILISDNGTGMNRDRFESLTAMRFTKTADRDVQSGLGLRLTRRLVELHGGELELVESPELKGTTLSLVVRTVS